MAGLRLPPQYEGEGTLLGGKGSRTLCPEMAPWPGPSAERAAHLLRC